MRRPIPLGDLAKAYARALAQLPGPRMLGVVLGALIIALVVTAPLLLVVLPLAALIDFIPTPAFLQSEGGSWLGWTTLIVWTYIMSPLAVAVVSLLLDRIVEAVEARHYPHLPPVHRRNMGEQIGYAIRFFGLMLGIMLVAALIAWLTPVPGWMVFTAASAYLIAREYYETVALRRMPPTDAKRDMSKNLSTLWVGALPVAVALNVPVLNLIAPIVGVAAFTHLFHRDQHSSRP